MNNLSGSLITHVYNCHELMPRIGIYLMVSSDFYGFSLYLYPETPSERLYCSHFCHEITCRRRDGTLSNRVVFTKSVFSYIKVMKYQRNSIHLRVFYTLFKFILYSKTLFGMAHKSGNGQKNSKQQLRRSIESVRECLYVKPTSCEAHR